MPLASFSLRVFCLALLCGSGQVVFMENALSGALNLLAFAWAAWAAGAGWTVLIGAFLGLLVATAVAWAVAADRGALQAGLYGFNGLLVGAAVAVFVLPSALMWLLLVLAAAGSVVLTLALQQWLAPARLAVLTAPFVLTGWVVVLAVYQWPALQLQGLAPVALAVPVATPAAALQAHEWLQAALTGVAQIFVVDNAVAGAIFVLALAVHSRWCALLALLGSLAGAATAVLWGAEPSQVLHGLWGYSAALTAPALGCIFLRPAPAALAWALLGAVCTTVVQGAAFSLLGPLGVPVFTAPFVLTTWVFLLAWRGVRASGP